MPNNYNYQNENPTMPSTSIQPYNEVGRYSSSPAISYRAYMGIIGLLTFLGFAVIAAFTMIMYAPTTIAYLEANPAVDLGITIGAFIASIAGIVMQFIGMRDRENPNIALISIGYILLVLSLGIVASFITIEYKVNSIIGAFIGTASLAGIMSILGFTFPKFFQKIAGILLGLLIGVIVAEIILMFMGVQQGITDWIVLAIFCGFIGVDTYRAASSRPTLANAIFWASSIYLDLINIFIRLLAIFGQGRE